MPSFQATLLPGDVIDLWARSSGDGEAWTVTIRDEEGAEHALTGGRSDDFQRTSHRIAAGGTFAVDWNAEDTTLSLAYAYTPARVLDEGVSLLWDTADNANSGGRYRLHLQPPWGWMNDPNGLIEMEGLSHAFYQHYPHARRWNTMHWAHAVSRNLIDWTHLPIFIDPRPELLSHRRKSGGAFSGSAIAAGDGALRVFHTDREDDRLPNWEWQVTALSSDHIHAGPAEPVITEQVPLPTFRRDQRDPYVFRGPDGLWKMVLGGGDARGGLIVLYETDDAEGATGWRLVGPLHAEPMRAGIPVECPCLIALDGEGEGLHVLIFGLLGQRDETTRRRNLSYAVVGRFDGRRFDAIARRELDFATDSYAFQGFRHRDHGPIGLAWGANWTDVHKDRDFPTAMTFPRHLIWRDGLLLTPPVETVRELRDTLLLDDTALLAEPLELSDGLAELELEFTSRGSDFTVEFEHPTHHLALISRDEVLELLFDPPGTRTVPRYCVNGARVRKLRIFIDVGLIEIYADDGRWCATKRIDSDEPVSAIRFHDDPEILHSARAWRLRPARGLPRRS